MQKRFFAFLSAVFCAALTVGAAGALTASAAFTTPIDPSALYVSTDGTQPASVPAGQRFTSVTDAVEANEAAGGGKTVYVDDGVYTGSFAVTKPVTLIGTSKNAILQFAPQDGGNPNGLWIESSDVVIDGLTLKSYDETRDNQGCADIYLYPLLGPISNITVKDCDLAVGYYADASSDNGYGILTQGTFDGTDTPVKISDVTVDNNSIYPLDETKGGARPLMVNNGVENLTVTDNRISGKFVSGSIVSGQNGKTTLDGNKFDAVSPYSLCLYGYPDESWGDVIVTHNEFSGAAKYPIYAYYCQVYNVLGNTFSDVVSTDSPMGVNAEGVDKHICIEQYLGSEDEIAGQPVLTPDSAAAYAKNTPYLYMGPAYTLENGSHFIDYVPRTYTVEYYKDEVTEGNQITTPAAVSGKTFLSDEPLTDDILSAELGTDWLLKFKPATGAPAASAGYGGFADYNVSFDDGAVKVLYQPVYNYTVNYYKDSVGAGNLLGTKDGVSAFPVGRILAAADVAADLGAGWLDLFKPVAGYESGAAAFITVAADPAHNTVNVIYAESPANTTTAVETTASAVTTMTGTAATTAATPPARTGSTGTSLPYAFCGAGMLTLLLAVTVRAKWKIREK